MFDGAQLYRNEALDASRDRLGDPANLFGLKSWAVPAFMTTLLVSVTVFISTAHYARKEAVSGAIAPADGVERAAAIRAGIVKQVFVVNGQHVRQGQPLFLVSYNQALEGGGDLTERLDTTSQAQLASLQQQTVFKKQQIAQSEAGTRARIRGLQDDIRRLSDQAAFQTDRVALLQKDFEAASTLMEKQYISQVQLMQKRDALLQGRQALSQIDQSIAANHNQIEQLGATLRSSQSAGAEAEAEADLRLIQAQFDEKQISTHASDGAQVSATRAGEVTNIQVRVGEVVAGNQTMGLVVPDGIRSAQRAELWVPSRAVGFIRPGNTVWVMFDAFPYQTFGVGKGRVVDVSSAPLMPNELPIPLETKDVVVALDGDALTAYGRKWVLLPGMRLTADVVLDEKSFLDWLLDPLLAIRKRAGG